MRFRVRVREVPEGVEAVCLDCPTARAVGVDRPEALARLRRAIVFDQEFCPCSGMDPEAVELDVEG